MKRRKLLNILIVSTILTSIFVTIIFAGGNEAPQDSASVAYARRNANADGDVDISKMSPEAREHYEKVMSGEFQGKDELVAVFDDGTVLYGKPLDEAVTKPLDDDMGSSEMEN